MACRQDRRRRASEKSKTHLWIVLGRSPRVLALISAHGGVRIRHPNWRVSQACGQEEAKRVANALVGGIFLVESMYSAGMSEAMTAGRSSRASTCTRDIQIDAQNTSSWMLQLSPHWLPDDPVLQQSRRPREAHAKRRTMRICREWHIPVARARTTIQSHGAVPSLAPDTRRFLQYTTQRVV